VCRERVEAGRRTPAAEGGVGTRTRCRPAHRPSVRASVVRWPDGCRNGHVRGRPGGRRLAASLLDGRTALGGRVRDDQLHAFVDDEVARRAVDARRRRRWLAQQLDEDRTFADVCRRATAAQQPVDVHVHGGRVYRGIARAAGDQVLAVVTASDVAYIAVDAVVGVRLTSASTLDAEPVATMRAATVVDVAARTSCSPAARSSTVDDSQVSAATRSRSPTGCTCACRPSPRWSAPDDVSPSSTARDPDRGARANPARSDCAR
jgi:hypothetical protein